MNKVEIDIPCLSKYHRAIDKISKSIDKAKKRNQHNLEVNREVKDLVINLVNQVKGRFVKEPSHAEIIRKVTLELENAGFTDIDLSAVCPKRVRYVYKGSKLEKTSLGFPKFFGLDLMGGCTTEEVLAMVNETKATFSGNKEFLNSIVKNPVNVPPKKP